MGRRTDLALEAQELWREGAAETTRLPGVRARTERWEGQSVTRVEILDERGEAALGKPVIVRTPVIPGVNDAEAEIVSIAAFLKEIGSLQYYELLNFNPMGASKYDSLEMNNDFRDARPLPKERIEALADAARALGLQVKVG